MSAGKRMTGLWRMGVPVATPVTARDCLAGLRALAHRTGQRTAFESEVRQLLGAATVRATNSGRAALFLTLEAMKRRNGRDEVVIPAFVCPSVGRAVVKAGLKPVLCDVEPNGFGLDLNALERAVTPRTLAVVMAHLYGYPSPVAPVLEIAHAAGALLVEDAAQAFGARLHGRYAGTLADAGIFSFGMSKVLWSAGAGLIATSDPELGSLIGRAIAACPESGRLSQAADLAKFAVLARLVRSHRLGPLSAVWTGVLRGKDDCRDFGAGLCPSSHAAIARALLPRLAGITEVRKKNALYYSAHLAGLERILLPPDLAGAEPVYLRFPVVVQDCGVKQELVSRLRGAGINVSQMYSRASYEALRGFAACAAACPRTEFLAGRMVNLPTHGYVREGELAAAAGAFHRSIGGPQPGPLPDRLREVNTAIREETTRIVTQRYGADLRAIVLTGSLARDEATLVADGPGWKLLGDADYFLVFRTGARLPSPAAGKSLEQDISTALRARGGICSVGLAPVHGKYFRKLPRHIAPYELRTCGRVVWGESGILSLVPDFTPAEISLEDAWRLLANRMVELLEAVAAQGVGDAAPSSEIHYRMVKLYLDMATSYLLFAGRYFPTYQERERALRQLANDPRSQAAAPFPLEPFAEKVSKCTRFKIEGQGWTEASWEDAARYARLLWRWELLRLSGETNEIPDSELLLRWMKRQPLPTRIRGWASVLRRCGWHRSWRQWPRWIRRGWQASPRYWVYATAATLISRFPASSSPSPASDTGDIAWTRLAQDLPLPRDRGPQAPRHPWTWIAEETARNYRQFLESTRA